MLQLPINSPRGWHRSCHSLTSASLIKGHFSVRHNKKAKTSEPWTRGCVLGCPQELPGCRKVWRKMRPGQKKLCWDQAWSNLDWYESAKSDDMLSFQPCRGSCCGRRHRQRPHPGRARLLPSPVIGFLCLQKLKLLNKIVSRGEVRIRIPLPTPLTSR